MRTDGSYPMIKAYIIVVISYLIALAAAGVTLQFVTEYHLMVQVLIADVVATVVIFAFSVAYKNSSFYDAYWSVIPMVIVGYLISLQSDADVIRQLMLALVILLWGFRLTINWAYTWSGLDHVDWRYVNLQTKAGIALVATEFYRRSPLPHVACFSRLHTDVPRPCYQHSTDQRVRLSSTGYRPDICLARVPI